jgi:hypothetical protein
MTGEELTRTAILLAPLLYLDPGSGSLLIQAIVAAILSFGYLTRQFWKNLFSRFSRRSRGKKDEGDDDSGST